MINLTASVRFHARRDAGKTAIIHGEQHISYGDLAERADRLAGYLAERGLGKGDVIAVLMKNCPAFIEIALATSHVGAIFLPINFRLAPAEVSFILANSGASMLFADLALAGNAAGFAPSVVLDDAARADTRSISGNAAPVEPADVGQDDLFRLMYTSGTTSHPKGVMHSYANFYWKSLDHVTVLELGSDTCLLVAGPLYHVGAFDLPGVTVLAMGGTLSLLGDFNPVTALEAIERDRIDGAWLAPVMTSALLSCDERHRFDVSSLRWVIGGGERTPEARIRSFRDYFTNARYIDAYGLTESCSGDTFMPAGREIEKIGSTGIAVPHVAIEIRDDEGGRLPAGEIGEICLKGPKVTAGYWRDQAKTAASFFGAWFRTGDVGYLDNDGFLFLTDRKKDMIISGGENIASPEVERVVEAMPEVKEAAVIGMPDPRWGEVPVAMVVLAEGATLEYDTLKRHCAASLAAFKVPKRLIVRDMLPRTPSGKVLKRELRGWLLIDVNDQSH